MEPIRRRGFRPPGTSSIRNATLETRPAGEADQTTEPESEVAFSQAPIHRRRHGKLVLRARGSGRDPRTTIEIAVKSSTIKLGGPATGRSRLARVMAALIGCPCSFLEVRSLDRGIDSDCPSELRCPCPRKRVRGRHAGIDPCLDGQPRLLVRSPGEPRHRRPACPEYWTPRS